MFTSSWTSSIQSTLDIALVYFHPLKKSSQKYKPYRCNHVTAPPWNFFRCHKIPFEHQIPVKTCSIIPAWCFQVMTAWRWHSTTAIVYTHTLLSYMFTRLIHQWPTFRLLMLSHLLAFLQKKISIMHVKQWYGHHSHTMSQQPVKINAYIFWHYWEITGRHSLFYPHS